MAETSTAPKRRRLRFSLRILLILITLACLYLGCWFPTATTGVRDVNERFSARTMPKAPLILVQDVYETLVRQPPPTFVPTAMTRRTRTYYFWFFGWSVELFTTQGFHDPPARVPNDNVDKEPLFG